MVLFRQGSEVRVIFGGLGFKDPDPRDIDKMSSFGFKKDLIFTGGGLNLGIFRFLGSLEMSLPRKNGGSGPQFGEIGFPDFHL